jgi:hypothetical protein
MPLPKWERGRVSCLNLLPRSHWGHLQGRRRAPRVDQRPSGEDQRRSVPTFRPAFSSAEQTFKFSSCSRGGLRRAAGRESAVEPTHSKNFGNSFHALKEPQTVSSFHP